MHKKNFSLLRIARYSIALIGLAYSEVTIIYKDNVLSLQNDVIQRQISLNKDGSLTTNSFRLLGKDREFVSKSDEFSFLLNDMPITGMSGWEYVSHQPVKDGIQLNLKSKNNPGLEIGITYLIYEESPIIRKKIEFFNRGNSELKIESLDIERLKFIGGGVGTDCWVMNDYARQKHLGQFIGEWHDPVMVVHHHTSRRGIFVGNEAPGVMKRTSAFQQPSLITSGLTHIDQTFGFRQWIKPDENWESTWVFSGLYSDSDEPMSCVNTSINNFVRNHMGCRIFKVDQKPVFIYNTWEPFKHNINEKMIYELVDACADIGIEEFIIDDGWQDSYGDWGVDKEKFPNGLKPVFDYIKSKGMKPGVWISLCSSETKSEVYKKHPEWTVKKANGDDINLHSDEEQLYGWESKSMCMTTGWKDYIRDVILGMVNDYGLEYIKGDFAAVTGAYTSDKTRSGCHSPHHDHKDRNESMLEMYQATWQLFDELHDAAPNLFIDCTFETMGALHLIDFDMCKHADGNWLSNYVNQSPKGALRVRNLAWSRTPTIPAASLVIGNQSLDDPNFMYSFKSLAGSLPIVLGDPRKLTPEQRKEIKATADWLKAMQKKHDFMTFRQDLSGFGEPQVGHWDGFQRINTETKSGGIVGVFKQESHQAETWVTVDHLDPDSDYEAILATTGEIVFRGTGEQLATKGFKVSFPDRFQGELFEINRR
ncbi:glycoside hydrolase family 36 protein [Luteolibacter algae]|uniref:Glycoside hydrolase family 36 protein n=1 Tax=Luteolibacter algae TaxID=454151 RepID=A0ABW5D3F9_9BACT